ncbi:MAG: thioredoxin family protein [Tenuifilaceae bacterium]|jgi:thiol-disulfide isomerase/thioredoxin|nr:thioredoxin family protein [Tenuifilaceae bacterium]
MKRIIFVLIGISLIGVALCMIVTIFYRINFLAQKLPNTQLCKLNGDPYNLIIKKNKILVFFKPDCYSCEQTVNEIINSGNELENVEVLFISSEHPDSVLLFSLNFSSEKITYLCDETALFSKELKVNKYPTIFIYSGKNQKLTKRFVGAVPLEQILQALSNE